MGGLAGCAPVIHEPEGRPPPPDTDSSLGESKGTKSQKVDYMNNPHLCPTAAQQLDKARSDAAAGLVQAMPWRETTMKKKKSRRVGHSQSGPVSQMQGGRLARQKESGGTLPWYPSDAGGGDADPKV